MTADPEKFARRLPSQALDVEDVQWLREYQGGYVLAGGPSEGPGDTVIGFYLDDDGFEYYLFDDEAEVWEHVARDEYDAVATAEYREDRQELRIPPDLFPPEDPGSE